MKSVNTYTASIYLGTKVGERKLSFEQSHEVMTGLYDICQKYCDEVKLCVTFTITEFIYTGGNEPGIVVGLINYPRFPSSRHDIAVHAVDLGIQLMEKAEQKRFSIVFPDRTVMFDQEDLKNKENIIEELS